MDLILGVNFRNMLYYYYCYYDSPTPYQQLQLQRYYQQRQMQIQHQQQLQQLHLEQQFQRQQQLRQHNQQLQCQQFYQNYSSPQQVHPQRELSTQVQNETLRDLYVFIIKGERKCYFHFVHSLYMRRVLLQLSVMLEHLENVFTFLRLHRALRIFNVVPEESCVICGIKYKYHVCKMW